MFSLSSFLRISALFTALLVANLAATVVCAQSEKTDKAVPATPLTEAIENTQSEAQFRAMALEKAALRDRFLLLEKAFSQKRMQSLSSEQITIGDYSLASYVHAWEILTSVQLASEIKPEDERHAQAFIEQHSGDYVAERFKTDWLKVSAQQLHDENRWREFERQRHNLAWNANEPEFQCWSIYHAFTKTADDDDDQLLSLERRTLSLLKNPLFIRTGICQKLSDHMMDRIPSGSFARLIVLIQQNRLSDAQAVLERLIKDERIDDATQAREALNTPEVWFKKHLKAFDKVDKFIALIAAYRLSRTNYAQAARIAQALHSRLIPREAAALWGRLGYLAALDHDKRALDWYQQGGKDVCSGPYMAHPEACYEWRVRSALREKRWRVVNAAINAMPVYLKNEETWQYWQGRALAAMGEQVAARRHWRKIKNVRTFYGKLAAQALGYPIVYRAKNPVEANPELVKALDANPHLERAREFYDLGLHYYGHREWNWGLKDQNTEKRLAIAQWAKDHHILDRMINTAERLSYVTHVHHDWLYPRPHFALIENESEKNKIQSSWVYGLIRQESRFLAMAQSHVGANGLMQIMPATAKWIAKDLNDKAFNPEDIYKVNTNIRYGTRYLRTLLTRLDENMVLATAGYNAGPHRAKRWRAALSHPMEAAIFIETIPYTETRVYVQNVLANTVEYAQLTDKPITNFVKFLGTITPKKPDNNDETI